MTANHSSDVSLYLPPPRTVWQERIFNLRMRTYYRAIWLKRLHRLLDRNESTNFSVLDVGCGPGYFLSVLGESHPQFNLIGLDLDDGLLACAQQRNAPAGLMRASAQQLPFPDQSFDLVVCNQVVEHLPVPISFFQEAHRVLRANGVLMFSTPNLNGLAARLLGHRWTGYRFDHISLGTPAQWHRLCSQAGFEILEEGTTALTGFGFMQYFPLSLFNWTAMSLVGFFPWKLGESYMAIAVRH